MRSISPHGLFLNYQWDSRKDSENTSTPSPLLTRTAAKATAVLSIITETVIHLVRASDGIS